MSSSNDDFISGFIKDAQAERLGEVRSDGRDSSALVVAAVPAALAVCHHIPNTSVLVRRDRLWGMQKNIPLRTRAAQADRAREAKVHIMYSWEMWGNHPHNIVQGFAGLRSM